MKLQIGSIKPTKIICVGTNYRDHAKELDMKIPDEPLIFLKPVSSLIYDSQEIVYPDGVARLDYEAELAVVIKETARNIAEKDVSRYIPPPQNDRSIRREGTRPRPAKRSYARNA